MNRGSNEIGSDKWGKNLGSERMPLKIANNANVLVNWS